MSSACLCGFNPKGQGYFPIPSGSDPAGFKSYYSQLGKRLSDPSNQCHTFGRSNDCYMINQNANDASSLAQQATKTVQAHLFKDAVPCVLPGGNNPSTSASTFLQFSMIVLAIFVFIF